MNVFSISEMIKSGWALFKENMTVCILLALVASLLSSITCGLLSGPMLAGVFIVIKKLIKRTDPKPTVNDVFGGFTYFLQTFLFILLMGIISGIFAWIPVLNIIVGFFSSSMLLWGVILITNHNMDCIQAIEFLYKGLFSGKFLKPLFTAWIALLIGALGCIACGIGVFFTMPLCYCIISVADNKIFEDKNIETSDVEVNCEE